MAQEDLSCSTSVMRRAILIMMQRAEGAERRSGKSMRALKKALFLSLAAFVVSAGLLILSIEGYAAYTISVLKPEIAQPAKAFPQDIKEMLWTELGYKPPLHIRPYYVSEVFLHTLLPQSGKPAFVGSYIPQRLTFTSLQKVPHGADRDLAWAILTAWGSRAYPTDQAIDAFLHTVAFGFRTHGLEEATGLYFGKSLDESNYSQRLTLIALSQDPAGLNPYCHLTELQAHASELDAKLRQLYPGRYDKEKYEVPELVEHKQVRCGS